ncbi:IS66-like element accessory protein TnpA [Methylocystis sp. H62]|uniref:IS66-like element accessory protein TnpA n=1 Tax=Methylocystis sp. H62 TaxID=2785789 RepID=UPI00391764AA
MAPDASVAAVARRYGLNANLVFKWIRRAREGRLDRRRAPAQEADASAVARDSDAPAFVPVKLVELNAVTIPALAPPLALAKPVREPRRITRRGAMEISLPNGARVSLDADVDAEALRRVLSALGDL